MFTIARLSLWRPKMLPVLPVSRRHVPMLKTMASKQTVEYSAGIDPSASTSTTMELILYLIWLNMGLTP
jgi:hypothetical protein